LNFSLLGIGKLAVVKALKEKREFVFGDVELISTVQTPLAEEN
jgi:hypothetical protein